MSESQNESFTFRFLAALATGISLAFLAIGWNINRSTQRGNDCAMDPNGAWTLWVAAAFAVIDIIVGIAAYHFESHGKNWSGAGKFGLWVGPLLLLGALGASFFGSTSCGS